jgi:hypothetical protein
VNRRLFSFTERIRIRKPICYTVLSWPQEQHPAQSGIIATIAPQLRNGYWPDLIFYRTKGRPPQHWRAFFLPTLLPNGHEAEPTPTARRQQTK